MVSNRYARSCHTLNGISVTLPTAPHTEVTEKDDIVYSEVVRENVRKLEAYAGEMASGDAIPTPTNIQKT